MLVEIIDAVTRELQTLAGTDSDSGGFRDRIELPQSVWFGNPGILPDNLYPYIYVEPVIGVKESETTANITRRYNVRIVLLIDPRNLYDETEVTEQTASREMIQTMEAIEQHFEKTTLRKPDGLAPGVMKVDLAATEYAQQIRGTFYSLGASILLEIDGRRLRID